MNSILHFYILILVTCYMTAGDNFLPTVLMSKIRSSSQLSLNQTEDKLWMKYLEKRLETIIFSFTKFKLSSSLLGFYKNIFRRKLFQDIFTNCNKMMPEKVDEIQTDIYGNICGSHVGGKMENSTWTTCQYFQLSICNFLKGKYIMKIFRIQLLSFDSSQKTVMSFLHLKGHDD